MSATISISDQNVFTALRSFLIDVLPGNMEIIQAQDNRVPMPKGSFVAMNNIGTRRISTNSVTYNDPGTNPGTMNVLMQTEYRIQLDFYGPNSAQWSNIVQALFRDEYATAQFTSTIQPLYADDPVQMPLIDGEQNYEQRWKLEAILNYSPTISVNQDYAGALTIGLKEVDNTFPV